MAYSGRYKQVPIFQGIHVALSGATLIIGKVRGTGKKLAGAEYAAELGLKVGDVLGA